MKRSLLACLATLIMTGQALAHTHLKASSPADGSTLATAPATFALTFAEPARLTALSLQGEGGKETKIADLPTAAASEFKVPAPALANGRYTLNYRLISADGHVMTGKIAFTVGGRDSAGKPAAADHHDHAGH